MDWFQPWSEPQRRPWTPARTEKIEPPLMPDDANKRAIDALCDARGLGLVSVLTGQIVQRPTDAFPPLPDETPEAYYERYMAALNALRVQLQAVLA